MIKMDNDSFYKPSGNIKDTNRTYVPDLYRQAAAEMEAEDGTPQPPETSSTQVIKLQNRSIIGVLYSISAGIEGEIFPVYVGRNIIGSDLSCDICLRETSVSSQHAILLARKQTDENGEEFINVILLDNNSSYGTNVNGNRIDFEKITCSDGDVINIGQNYVLVLSLFNAFNKLSVAYGFDRIPVLKKKAEEKHNPLPTQAANIISEQSPQREYHATNVTQDMQDDSSVDFYKPTKQQGQDHYNNKTIIL